MFYGWWEGDGEPGEPGTMQSPGGHGGSTQTALGSHNLGTREAPELQTAPQRHATFADVVLLPKQSQAGLTGSGIWLVLRSHQASAGLSSVG